MNEVLFEGSLFHLGIKIERLPGKHIHVYISENGELKKYDFGHLQNPSYSNFYSVYNLFSVSMDRILKEAADLLGKSAIELKHEEEYKKFMEFLDGIKSREKDA